VKQTLPLFDTAGLLEPRTEGVKYAGSKLKILPSILQLSEKVGAQTVLDGFSGTTRVSQALAQNGYCVLSNDVAVWSEFFATCYLRAKKPLSYYDELINYLNSVTPIEGWFTENYGGYPNDGNAIQSDGLKKPWQIHNTMKLDGIREEIDQLELDFADKAVAVTSLILALDKVDNTLGHFVSYLKEWSARSFNDLTLKVPNIIQSQGSHSVSRQDIFSVAKDTEADISYFDPPYGSNNEKMPPSRVRYNSYYHLWTTICLNDKPKLFGKARRRIDSSDLASPSVFEDFRRNEDGEFFAVKAIEKVIEITSSRWIILSYSSGGRATAEELNSVMKKNGELLDVVELDYKRNVMAEMKWTNEWLRDAENPNREFLFLLEKG
jgi:adenine-specific DNA-methyltransferase